MALRTHISVALVVCAFVGGGCRAASAEQVAQKTIPIAARTAIAGLFAFDSKRAVWVMRADGSGRRQVSRPGPGGNDFSPSLSPDGKRVVFRTSRGTYERVNGGVGAEGIFIVDIATRNERAIHPPTGGLFPAWSPDGKTIAFSAPRDVDNDDGIKLMKTDGSDVRDLGLPRGGNECATWSPDSRQILFCHHNGDGNWAIWLVDADGTNPHQLTHPTLQVRGGNGGDYPGPFSRDGKRFAYSSGIGERRDLYVMNTDGSGRRRVLAWRGADAPNAWLPNGDLLFAHFRSDSAPRPDWYLIRPDGTRLRSVPWLAGAGDPLSFVAARR